MADTPTATASLNLAQAAAQTFRLPSTTLFLGLMPVFSGLARRADLAAVLAKETEPKTDAAGQWRAARVHTYIVYSRHEAVARTSLSLFDDDPLWNEGELSLLIKRQFGPTGLKHLLGIMIAAEEQAAAPGAQPGAFIFDASRHLDILGYSRSNRVNGKGYHTAKHLREAREIVMLLCSLTIVQETRLGERRGTTLKVRLLHDEASAEAWEETITDGDRLKERILTNEKIFLRFNPHLFLAAAEGTSRTQYLYTLQLKKLARENARSHGLALTLGVHLPIKFRLNNCQPLTSSARSFLRMAGIVEDEYTRYDHLERLENTLRYLVEQGYLSSFETQRFRFFACEREPAATGRALRTQLELKSNLEPPEPLEEMWSVEPPEFLCELLKTANYSALAMQANLNALALSRPSKPAPMLPGAEAGGRPPGAAELLRGVRKSLKLQQSELARKLGVTQAAVSMAEAGKRPHMAARFLEMARRLH